MMDFFHSWLKQTIISSTASGKSRTFKRIGYSLAVLLIMASPLGEGVSKVWASTTWSATDLTGSGSFTQPFAIAVDGSGDVFVTNQSNSSPAVEELQNGTWTDLTVAPNSGGSFDTPSGIAVDSHGNVYVTNELNAGIPSVEELSNGIWTDITHGGTFSSPYGIAVDGTGNVFVTNAGNNTIEELPHGSTTWTNISGSGSFSQPQGIAVDNAGDLFVTNDGNGTIEELPGGPGGTWQDITGTGGNFSNPIGITVDSAGNVFVADSSTNALEERPSGSSTWTALSGNGVFMSPAGIAVDSAGNLYVANTAVSTGGSGPGVPGGSGPGVPGGSGPGVPGGGGGGGAGAGGSAVVEYTPSLASPTAPSAPTGLTASGTTSTGTTLTWTGVTGATSYNVYENTSTTSTIIPITGATSYTATGLTAGTSYSFTVTAVNSGGESSPSNSVTVNPLNTGSIDLNFGSTTLQSGTSTTVTGVVYDNNAPLANAVVNLSSTIGYWGASGTNSSETVTADVYGSFSTSWRAPTVTAATSGTATASVTAAVYGVTPATVSINITPPPIVTPSAPTGLSASNTTSTGTKLTWNATSGATSYDVYQGGTQIATGLTSTSYAVTGLTSGTSYSFKVSAVNSGGVSPLSSPVTVTTIVVSPPAPILSNNTQILDKASDSQKYVWNVDQTNGSTSVTVVNGSNVVDLLGAIASTDGSIQTYKVQDKNGNPVTGSMDVANGDVLVVTAADGKTTANYTISTWQDVSTAAQLEQIDKNQSDYLSANIKLMNDIDLTGYNWVPLGNGTTYFTGTFDGQGHQVTGVSIQDTSDSNVGFFGYFSGTIENVGVDVTVTGSAAGGSVTGGLVGAQEGGSISDSYATGSVTGGDQSHIGGLVGEQDGGSISNSYATGSVTGGGGGAEGGLVGYQYGGGSISNSYATGSVTGGGGAAEGGLVGEQDDGTILDSYATGPVTGGDLVGGLVGDPLISIISGSFFDTQTTKQSPSYVGRGESTAVMQTPSTYSSWDFTKTWAISPSVNGGYPYLQAVPLQTSTASQTFGASGGTMQQTLGSQTVSVNVPDGAFSTQESVKVSLVPTSNVTNLGLPKSNVAAVLDVSFSGASPTKPVTVTIANASIKAGGAVYKKTSDGKLVALKATVVDGKATVSFTSDPTFVVLNLKQNERVITMVGHAQIVPGLAKAESAGGNETSYMPIWYVMQLLKPLGITNTWNGTVWQMTASTNVDLSHLSVGRGKTSIYLNGTMVQKVDTVASADPSTGRDTSYMPIWYVMQLLKRLGLQSTWDGTTWTVTK